MNLPSLSINRPVLAIVMSLLIILFGLIGFKFLGIREYPAIDPPVITVRTGYAGANADVVESQITEPLEKAINGIAGIRTISSSSNLGNSVITVEFDLNTDLEAATNDVRDKVSQAVRNLPQDIDALPSVTKSDANSDAIISVTVQSDTKNVLEISDYAENIIGERLQTIPGVSNIQIWGQKRYAMRLWLDPAKLAAYKLTPLDVRNALEKENVDLPGGKIVGNNSELTVKTVGRLSNEQEFNDLMISSEGDRIIRLKDVGYATLGPENEETILKNNGTPMVACALVPQPGANYIDIADEFYKRLELIKKDLPSDIRLDIVMDNTKFVRKSVKEVEETLLIAVLLVVIIIFLFFRDWLIAFRPLIDIPVSLIGVFFIMYLMGFSINVLTLLAVVLATGLVVDDGIVVTENIFKKVEKGMSPVEAAHRGSREIFFVVISTSITLAAVFLPVIFMEGFVGRLFREFGIVLSSAVLISAFVSLSLTPMLNARLFRKGKGHSKFYEATEPFFRNLENGYRRSLGRFMDNKATAGLLFALVTSMIFFFGKQLQSELAPTEDRSWFRMLVTAPEGASFEYTDRHMAAISQYAMDSIPEKRIVLTVTAPGFAGSGAVNTGFGRVVLSDPEERKRSQQEVVDQMSGFLRKLPTAKTFAVQEQTISAGGGPRGSLPVQFVIQTSDFNKLKAIIPKFMKEVAADPVFQGNDVNLKFNKPELQITIDREKAKTLGLSVKDVAQTLQLAYSGQRFAYFQREGKQYQVIGQFDRANRDEPMDLRMIFLRNNQGQLIQLDNVVTLEEQSSPPQLYHYNRFKSATVSAGLAPGRTIGDGVAAMQKIADRMLDDNYSTALTGASRDYAESSSNALYAFLLALLIIYLILAAQFESFIDPMIIISTVPLALGGAVFSLWYFNQTLNIFSQIGMIMLIGLVTKNGIMIVEFANQLREQGREKYDAIIEASVLRLRPILMTSIATILGAMPIAMALGAGSKSRIPMGIVIVGGLLFALILTLYLIPVIYQLFSRRKKPISTETFETNER